MTAIDSQKDYYALLALSSLADEAEIKQAYRELARRYHPDGADGDAPRFRAIQEAYEVLRDVTLRQAYDRQREMRGLSAEAPIIIEMLLSRETLPMLDTAQMLYVLLSLKAAGELRQTSHRLNLALVVDRSNSMRGARMQNVKMAAMDLVEALHPEDRLALIAFSDRAEVLAPSTVAQDRRVFGPAIAALQPGGGTEIFQGLLAGLEEVYRHADPAKINHVILLTDGRTYGDEDAALTAARRAGERGIGISAFGIGEDWNDDFLDALARCGGGVSHYIDSVDDVRRVLREQIQGLSGVLAHQLTLNLNLASYVQPRAVYRASPYMEVLSHTANKPVPLGRLTLGEPTEIVLELLIEAREAGERRIARIDIEAEEIGSAQRMQLRQDVRITLTHAAAAQAVPPKLLNIISRLSVFQLQEKAWRALEQGDARQATHYLEAAATRLFDMGFRDLGQAAMLEVGRLSRGGAPTEEGRKKLRYGTRALTIPSR